MGVELQTAFIGPSGPGAELDDRPPICLLHGFDGTSLDYRRLKPVLSEKLPTWAVDLVTNASLSIACESLYLNSLFFGFYTSVKSCFPSQFVGSLFELLLCHSSLVCMFLRSATEAYRSPASKKLLLETWNTLSGTQVCFLACIVWMMTA